jgi:CPA2 family monovalent cation:H+ antiporter-2
MLDFSILGFISLASIISTLASIRLKAPAVIFLIILGMIFGPHSLGFIKESETIELFSEIGSILLLFLIGMEFNFKKLKEAVFAKATTIFLFEFVFLLILMYSTFSILGFKRGEKIFLSSIFAITSTALLIRILKEMNLDKRKEVPLIVGVSILEDVSVVFLLSLISNLALGEKISLDSIFFSLLKSLFLLLFVIAFLLKVFPFFSSYLPRDDENIFMLAVALLSFFVWLTSALGMSSSLGAFIAGSIISSLLPLKTNELIEKASTLFVSVFFLSFGMCVNPVSVLYNLPMILLLSFLTIIGKLISIAFGFLIFGYSIRSSLFASSSMVPLGEISILLASYGAKLGIISTDFFGIISSIVMIPSLASYTLIMFHEKMGKVFEKAFAFSFGHSITSQFISELLKLTDRVQRKEELRRFILFIFFLSILYFNLPFHQKDFTVISITIFLTFLAILQFYYISKRFVSFIRSPLFFLKIIKIREIQVEFSIVLILILFAFLYCFFVEEETKLWFLLPSIIITFVAAVVKVTRNL